MENDQSNQDIYHDFRQDVNMTASELTKWLETEDSKSVGQDSGDGASIGHHSGEHIGFEPLS